MGSLIAGAIPEPMVAEVDALPVLVRRASDALSGATTHAEVLEARDMAGVAYQAAKAAGRMAKAKKAHDALLAAVYRAQGHALLIEARAKMRLAEEYDAAQERGEVARLGDNLPSVGDSNAKPTAADLGLRRDEIHEARQIRDSEAAEPGAVEGAIGARVARGEEPTKAKLKRDLAGPREPEPASGARSITDADVYRATEFLANLLLNGFFDDYGASLDAPDEDALWVMRSIKARGARIGPPVARAAAFFRHLDEVVNDKGESG